MDVAHSICVQFLATNNWINQRKKTATEPTGSLKQIAADFISMPVEKATL
jgi:hypothetical protein